MRCFGGILAIVECEEVEFKSFGCRMVLVTLFSAIIQCSILWRSDLDFLYHVDSSRS